jgi:hypothetical protein
MRLSIARPATSVAVAIVRTIADNFASSGQQKSARAKS